MSTLEYTSKEQQADTQELELGLEQDARQKTLMM